MTIPIFYASEDAYWWILCLEKFFKEHETPKSLKILKAVGALRGSAFTWWIWWCRIHPRYNWDTFTTALLWRFKPEWREILPISDEKEEPIDESSYLMEQHVTREVLLGEKHEKADLEPTKPMRGESCIVGEDLEESSDPESRKLVEETSFHEDFIMERANEVVPEMVITPLHSQKHQHMLVTSYAASAKLFQNNEIIADKGELYVSTDSITTYSTLNTNSVLLIDTNTTRNTNASNLTYSSNENISPPPKPPEQPNMYEIQPLLFSEVSDLGRKKTESLKEPPPIMISDKTSISLPPLKPPDIILSQSPQPRFVNKTHLPFFNPLSQAIPTQKNIRFSSCGSLPLPQYSDIIYFVSLMTFMVEPQIDNEGFYDDADFTIPPKPPDQPYYVLVYESWLSKWFCSHMLYHDDNSPTIWSNISVSVSFPVMEWPLDQVFCWPWVLWRTWCYCISILLDWNQMELKMNRKFSSTDMKLLSITSGSQQVSFRQKHAQELFEKLSLRPGCTISDFCIPWTSQIAEKHQIPWCVGPVSLGNIYGFDKARRVVLVRLGKSVLSGFKYGDGVSAHYSWAHVEDMTTSRIACKIDEQHPFVVSLFSGWIADKADRRRSFQLCVFLMIMGALISATANAHWGILLGRLFVGTGMRLGPPVAALYVAEISPPTRRGAFGGLTQNTKCLRLMENNYVATCNLFELVFSMILMDKLGRKMLLLGSLLGMTVTMGIQVSQVSVASSYAFGEMYLLVACCCIVCAIICSVALSAAPVPCLGLE